MKLIAFILFSLILGTQCRPQQLYNSFGTLGGEELFLYNFVWNILLKHDYCVGIGSNAYVIPSIHYPMVPIIPSAQIISPQPYGLTYGHSIPYTVPFGTTTHNMMIPVESYTVHHPSSNSYQLLFGGLAIYL